ncbi:hypothetical protein M595_2961 [Lyngbya aestuarii BL J]|uniref:Uncharacterized protein n=1 Tax=Lyngbya aestuarii BL J TaxID=1348334 RepID=U7QL02_9CYAN|nr:hypothetical protein M595_2961 [Lyngbya aestuarii BL J]
MLIDLIAYSLVSVRSRGYLDSKVLSSILINFDQLKANWFQCTKILALFRYSARPAGSQSQKE